MQSPNTNRGSYTYIVSTIQEVLVYCTFMNVDTFTVVPVHTNVTLYVQISTRCDTLQYGTV